MSRWIGAAGEIARIIPIELGALAGMVRTARVARVAALMAGLAGQVAGLAAPVAVQVVPVPDLAFGQNHCVHHRTTQ